MKLRELLEQIEEKEIATLEVELDRLFKEFSIDIEFTRHFKDRLNDVRNGVPITIEELRKIFKDTYKKYGKQMSATEESFEAVLKDLSTNLNIPFVLKDVARDGERDFVSKTIMRKKNFTTPNETFVV